MLVYTTSDRRRSAAATPLRRIQKGRGRWLCWSCLWSTVLLMASSSASAANLAWKLKPEQRLRFVVERTLRQKSPSTEWTESIRYQVLWVVGEPDEEGRIQIRQSLTDVKHSLQLPNAPVVVFDSTIDGDSHGDTGELGKYWSSLLTVERPLTLMPSGTLVPVPASEAATSAKTAAPADANAKIATSRTTASVVFSNIAFALPAAEVVVGDTWEERQIVPWRDLPEALEVLLFYTYAGEVELEQQRVDQINVQAEWIVQLPGSVQRQIRIERQQGTGTIYFDREAGLLRQAEFLQDLAVSMIQADAEPKASEISSSLRIQCLPVLPVAETPSSTTPEPDAR